ncbi:hypothetical protein CALCODRAFT_24867 [Calocera cornea HHB12733]|uniref:Uncharacterized protein n=1 Tax=Calocera cornea HHB12733 TaxID=1353952 RepID=A0A165J228_9BASI|nr:hypothetical protein CALCODRAFT_24867 [Calocera cornea HHB12733]
MGDDPEHEPQQEAIVLNDATSVEPTVATGVENVGSETRPEQGHDEVHEDPPEQGAFSTNADERNELFIDTQAAPNGREEDATEHAEGQQHADSNDEAGHEGSALSTPVETPSVGNEHAATSMSLFPAGTAHLGPPKKFVSSANINKKFLQKTATPTPPPAPGKGVIPTIARPASVTPTQSQSRLITTKLTMVAPAVHATSAGWNKSNTPSGAPSPQFSATPLSSQAHTPAGPTPAASSAAASAAALQSASFKLSTSAFPAPRPAGMGPFATVPTPAAQAAPAALQMQKQSMTQTNVWGHPAPAAVVVPTPILAVDADFPTAAEAARGKRPRVGPLHKAEAHPPPLADTSADAFRGVHLDPNAHHWDDVRLLHYYTCTKADWALGGR